MSGRCQIYLAAPSVLPSGFPATLAAVLAAAPIACLRLPALPDISDLVKLAQASNVAVVLDGDAELARRVGSDGVHLSDGRDYRAAREVLGAEAIVGVACGRSRHAAMEAGEAGADYITFEADLELVSWWAEAMVVPVVVELGDDAALAGQFARAGAEFVLLGAAIFAERSGAVETVKRVAEVIA